MHTITLINYDAVVDGKEPLCLGTFLSYGVEQLNIIPGDGWDGLAITATFSQGGKALAEPILVTETGVINVPAGATAKTITFGNPGVIVFRGVANGVQRIATNVRYSVADHGPVDGDAPAPEPGPWEQFVSAVKEDACRASRSASQAADSAEAAQQAQNAAQQSAGQADTSAEKAQNSADDAAQSAKLAQQGAANAGWFTVEGKDGILYFTRSDNAPEDFKLQDNGKGVLEAVYG